MTGRARRSVEVRRDEILGATVDLLDRIGLADTRVSDVAESLGVSPSLVFYHFGTKDDLVAEAFGYAVEQDLARLEKAAEVADPVERVRRVLRLYGPTGKALGWRLWIDAWAVAQREAHVRQVLRRMDRRWTTLIRQVVDDGVAAGAFTCRDPEASAARLRALLDGLSVAVVVHRSVTRPQLRTWVSEQIALELGVHVDALA